jgi:hypothetical protein
MRRHLKSSLSICLLALCTSAAAAANLPCGLTHGAFTAPGQTISYSLAGVAGDVVRIASTGTSGGVCPQVVIAGVGSSDCADILSTHTLPITSTYTIFVTDKDGSHVGGFDLNLIYVTPKCVAAVLGCEVIVTNALTSTIEQHAYSFEGSAGDAVQLTPTSANGFCLDIDLFFSGTNLTTFACNNDPTATFTLPGSGTYVAVVRERSLDGPTGYTLGLSYATTKCALAALSCGAVTTNRFVDPVQRHSYTFAGVAGDAIQVAAKAAFGSCLDADVFLSGTYMATFGCFDDPFQTFTLPETGSYVIVVRENDLDGTGSYTLGLSYATPKCGPPLTCAATTNTLVDPLQRHTYTLDGRAGDVIGFTMSTSPADICLQVAVFLGGTGLVTFDCGNPDATFTLPATGTYALVVSESPASVQQPGTYVLGLAGLSSRCGTILNCGQTILDNFTAASQQHSYTFYGYPGEVVRLSRAALSGGVCPDMDMFNPAGTYITTLPCEEFFVDLTLTTNGAYSVLASERNSGTTGTYAVTLLSLSGCFQLAPGSAVVRTQTVACLPLQVISGSPVETINFSVQAPCGNLAAPTLSTGTRFTSASVTPGASCQWLVSLQASPTNLVVGSASLGSLCFTAVSTQSAFVPITISDLRVTNLDGSVVSGLAQNSRVVVIANQPLLEASLDTTHKALSIYGKANTAYEIQTESALSIPALWTPGWTNTVPATLFYSAPVPTPFSNAPTLFLRARER